MCIDTQEGEKLTEKQVAKMLRLRDKGYSYTQIALMMDTSQTTVRRYCQLDRYATGCNVSQDELPYIATEKTCGGCMYFQKLHPTHSRPNFCAYTLMTGKAKDITVPCAKCKLKRRK